MEGAARAVIDLNVKSSFFVAQRVAKHMIGNGQGGTIINMALHRIGRPAEVSGAVAFLASPAASLITGHALIIDGSWTAR